MALNLGPDSVWHLLQHLGPADVGKFAQVCKEWSSLACDDVVWKRLCKDELGVTSLDEQPHHHCDAGGAAAAAAAPCTNYKDLWTAYQVLDAHHGGNYIRARKVWNRAIAWLERNAPDCKATLNPAATEEQLVAAEKRLGIERLPNALRAIYAVHNGQKLDSHYFGLFGAYTFYDAAVCMYLLPVEALQVGPHLSSKIIVFAASLDGAKIFCLDATTGSVMVQSGRSRIPCCPAPADGDRSKDVLRWFEAYVDDLCADTYPIRLMDPEDESTMCIWRFPQKGPTVSEAVTNGVRVRVSSVYCPEHQAGFFSYSVRMSLLAGAALRSCQLMSRHWVITADSGRVEEVRGEAVIGLYPLLEAGGPEFSYQSCTTTTGGRMEGEFQMVPGSIANPTGEIFDAIVAPFPLQLPQFIH